MQLLKYMLSENLNLVTKIKSSYIYFKYYTHYKL